MKKKLVFNKVLLLLCFASFVLQFSIFNSGEGKKNFEFNSEILKPCHFA